MASWLWVVLVAVASSASQVSSSVVSVGVALKTWLQWSASALAMWVGFVAVVPSAALIAQSVVQAPGSRR